MRTLYQQRPFFIWKFILYSTKGRLLLGGPLMHTSLFSLLLTFASLLPSPLSLTQTTKQPAAHLPVQLLTRTPRRHESARFSYGGPVTLIGAPRGAVTVEGWNRSEVE